MGPIPAGAGEPSRTGSGRSAPGAYPRRRGGTHSSGCTAGGYRGLSPQARGNHSYKVDRLTGDGPIPAGAGEPGQRPDSTRRQRAYPRRRGGTSMLRYRAISSRGLSPQARGNQHDVAAWREVEIPIPAGAGEPGVLCDQETIAGAYPRRRGGTIACPIVSAFTGGLSPQARGNLVRSGFASEVEGPIPAGAGEPTLRHD